MPAVGFHCQPSKMRELQLLSKVTLSFSEVE